MIKFEKLIGAKINKIFINSDYLIFDTDKGKFGYRVSGDCCSFSYFHDFSGIENLLKNGIVKSVESIDLDEGEPVKTCCENCKQSDVLAIYGYRIITENPEFGEMSSVLSFRNDSNGYYGGSLETIESWPNNIPEITTDWINS